MTDVNDELKEIEHAASRLVPQLTERLARHGLGEIEVRRGGLRVRVTRRQPSAEPTLARAVTAAPREAEVHSFSTSGSRAVTATAVGFFVYADGLGLGLEVAKGDELGHVDVLGVRHDVRAPRRGTVRSLVAESGEAVEYGQVVIELEPVEVNA